MHGGVANQLIKLLGGPCAQDCLIGGAKRCEHFCQSSSRSLVALAGIFAIEVVEPERQIFNHAREKRDCFFVEGVNLVEHDHQHADALATTDHRQRRRGTGARTTCDLVPGLQAFVVEEVIADARL